jgi:O-antigen ligase
MPALIFLAKLFLTIIQGNIETHIPEALLITYSDSRFYIPKIAYVSFCIPSVVTSVISIQSNILNSDKNVIKNFPFVFILIANFLTFISINTKNGVFYGIFIILALAIKNLKFLTNFKNLSNRLIPIICVLFIIILAASIHIQQNRSWLNLVADVKVGLQIEKYQNWKNGVNGDRPINEYGEKVYGTNYERSAWLVAGLQLLKENAMGYGLVENSFGHLAKLKWPESKLHQTHSGWLDLALGIGVPGLLLLLTAIFMGLFNIYKNTETIANISFWILISVCFIWVTTELSQKVYLDGLFFWTMFCSGINIGYSKKLRELK